MLKAVMPIIGGLIILPTVLGATAIKESNDSYYEQQAEIDPYYGYGERLWDDYEIITVPDWIWQTKHDNDGLPDHQSAWGGGADMEWNWKAANNKNAVLNLIASGGKKTSGPFDMYPNQGGKKSIDQKTIKVQFIMPKFNRMQIPMSFKDITFFDNDKDNYGLSVKFDVFWKTNTKNKTEVIPTNGEPFEYRYDLKDNYKSDGTGAGVGGDDFSLVPHDVADDNTKPGDDGYRVEDNSTEDYYWNNNQKTKEPVFWWLNPRNINNYIRTLVWDNTNEKEGNINNPFISQASVCNTVGLDGWFASCMKNTKMDADGNYINPLSFIYKLPIYKMEANNRDRNNPYSMGLMTEVVDGYPSAESRFMSYPYNWSSSPQYTTFWRDGFNIASDIPPPPPKPKKPLTALDKEVLILLGTWTITIASGATVITILVKIKNTTRKKLI